jgi:lysozyme
MFRIRFYIKALLIIFSICTFICCDRDTIRLEGYSIEGIDISHYQNKVNWDTLAAQNIKFVYVKATEGETHSDTFFCNNWDNIKTKGMKRGAYHYYKCSVSPEKQALNFIQNVSLSNGDLPPVIDIEESSGQSKESILINLKIMLKLIESSYGTTPIIYTHFKFYNKYIAGNFDNYPIWIARYGYNKPSLSNQNWTFWQYGNKGKLRGIKGYVDLNVFNGDSIAFDKLCIGANNLLSLK